MSAIDELLENNAAYAHAFNRADLPSAPAKKVAVCSTRRNSGYGLDLAGARLAA